MRTEAVILHDQDGFAGMRAAGHLAATALDMIAQHVRNICQNVRAVFYIQPQEVAT